MAITNMNVQSNTISIVIVLAILIFRQCVQDCPRQYVAVIHSTGICVTINDRHHQTRTGNYKSMNFDRKSIIPITIV